MFLASRPPRMTPDQQRRQQIIDLIGSRYDLPTATPEELR